MDFDSILSLVKAYAETRPYITYSALAALLFFFYLRPMVVFKSVLGIGALLTCLLIFQSLTGTLDSGIKNRDSMLEVESGN